MNFVRRIGNIGIAYRTWTVNNQLDQIPCPPCGAKRGTDGYVLEYGEEAQCPDCGDI